MQVVVSETSAFERTLEVTLEQGKVDSAYEKAFGKAARRLALPGFRKGKVPLPLAKKYISEDGLGGDVVDDLVPHAYHEALVQEKLVPISEPKLELVQRERGKDLIFKIKFEVRPALHIQDYQKVVIKAEEFDVTDEQFEKAVEELLGQHATLAPVEGRSLQDGDSAYVDYTATVDGEVFEGGKSENTLLEMKKDNFIPGFIDQVVGLNAGEEKEFDIVFPVEYGNASLAGKEVHFKFKLRELKARQLPELTDEYVKSTFGAETVEVFRSNMRERLQVNAERRVRESVSARIIGKLLDQVPDKDVPRSLFSWRANLEIQRRRQELNRLGITLEKYLEAMKTDQQSWLNQQAMVGMMEARVQLLIEAISDQEDLAVKEEELEQLLIMDAANRGVSVEQLKKVIAQEHSEEQVRYAILSAKVRDFLFESAEITFVPEGTPLEDPVEAAALAVSEESRPALEAGEAAPEAEAKPAKATRAKKVKAEEPPSEAADPEAKVEETVEGEKPKAKRASKKKAEE